MQYPRLRFYILIVVLALIALAWTSAGRGGSLAVPGGIASYILLMLLPGLAFYLFIEKEPNALEASLSAAAVSPVFFTIVSVLLIVGGVSAENTAIVALAVTAAIGIGATFFFKKLRLDLDGRQWLVLAGTVLAVLFLIGYLPFTESWWRFRSDAWFHRAVVAQIDAFGLPPEDPYFAGYGLQYMWFFHVLVLVLSHATGLDPFMVPTILNLHCFCGFVIATVLLAGIFKKRFSYRFASTLTVLLGMNGLFWLFLPLKAIKAFTGEVRGLEEIVRQFTITPFNHLRAHQFFTIYYNQDFLLRKFMVATPFCIGLVCMGLFWYGTVGYLSTRRPALLMLTSFALLGMLTFHPLVGFVMMAGFVGTCVLLFLVRSRLQDFSLKPFLVLAGVCLVSTVLTTPYLYVTMHLKESEQLIPISVTLSKISGIVISCAAVIFLALFQRTFWKDSGTALRYFQFMFLTVAAFCFLIKLPGPNTYDKLPIFVFYPLAVVGGWSFVDYLDKQRTGFRKGLAVVLIAVLFLVPVNAISFAAYFNTPTEAMYSEDEEHLAVWVRENTARESVFIDRDNEIFLLVAGPRRYFFGTKAYAQMWGYDAADMAAREHVRDALYDTNPLEPSTLRILGDVSEDLFVIDRGHDQEENGTGTLIRYPQYFKKVYYSGMLSLYQVDTQACRDAGGDNTLPVQSEEESRRDL